MVIVTPVVILLLLILGIKSIRFRKSLMVKLLYLAKEKLLQSVGKNFLIILIILTLVYMRLCLTIFIEF